MATKKNKPAYIVLKEDTKRLLRMIGAQMQFETGDNVSDDDALYNYIKRHSPELVKTLEEQKSRETELQTEL